MQCPHARARASIGRARYPLCRYVFAADDSGGGGDGGGGDAGSELNTGRASRRGRGVSSGGAALSSSKRLDAPVDPAASDAVEAPASPRSGGRAAPEGGGGGAAAGTLPDAGAGGDSEVTSRRALTVLTASRLGLRGYLMYAMRGPRLRLSATFPPSVRARYLALSRAEKLQATVRMQEVLEADAKAFLDLTEPRRMAMNQRGVFDWDSNAVRADASLKGEVGGRRLCRSGTAVTCARAPRRCRGSCGGHGCSPRSPRP